MSIHQRIKDLRIAKGLSQDTLADKLGVSRQTVQQWERENGTAPKRSRIGDVAKILETTPEHLLYGDNSPPHGHTDGDWPFPSISPKRYAQLTPNQKMAIEDWVRSRIEDFLT